MANIQRKKKGGRKLIRAAHHAQTGKYVRQHRRTAANKAARIEKEIEFLKERLVYWRTRGL